MSNRIPINSIHDLSMFFNNHQLVIIWSLSYGSKIAIFGRWSGDLEKLSKLYFHHSSRNTEIKWTNCIADTSSKTNFRFSSSYHFSYGSVWFCFFISALKILFSQKCFFGIFFKKRERERDFFKHVFKNSFTFDVNIDGLRRFTSYKFCRELMIQT